MRKYQIISADGHVETPPNVWTKYVPDAYRERAPRMIKLPEGGEGWAVEGRPMLHNGRNISGGREVKFAYDSYFDPDGTPAAGAGPAQQRLREQDVDGIDAEVLFPPVYATSFVEGIPDKKVYLSMVQAYNTFLAQDYCAVAPDRLIGNAVIPVSGIDDAVAELKRSKELGLRSVALHQFPNGSGEAKPEDDRFWEAALKWGVRLSPHANFGGQSTIAGSDIGIGNPQYATALTRRGAGGPAYTMAQLIVTGTLDRLPELRIYFAETNAFWVPGTFFMMDDSYTCYKGWFKRDLKKLPSEYMAQHFLFSFIRDPLAMPMRNLYPQGFAENNLMWGSDFPHSVGSFPESRKWIGIVFKDTPEYVKRRILLETPARFYGLDLEKPLTATPR